MRRLRKTITAILVWAATASSLLGSTLHFTCRCPDGTVKPFCTGQGSSESSCCCNGKCCCSTSDGGCCGKSSSSHGQKKKNGPSCCQQGKPEASSEAVGPRSGSQEHLTISRNCCQKMLVQTESQTLVRPVTKPIKQLELSLALQPLLNIGSYVPSPLLVTNGWQVYRLPPPTDLLTLLQRLLI